MLIDMKSTLTFKVTLVPLFYMSDGTHLANLAGGMKEWPVYMTIGNVLSKIRRILSTHSVVMVALLPIPIKNRNISQNGLHAQRQTNREVLNEILWRVLQPLTLKQNPSTGAGITTHSVQMATSGFANRFQQQGLQIAQSLAIYIILSGMTVFGVSVQRSNLEIMSLLTSNTLGGITTNIEHSAMPTLTQLMPNTCHAMSTKISPQLNIFRVL